jgi:hypothetical protein
MQQRSERYLAKRAAKRRAQQEAQKRFPREPETKPPKRRRILRIVEWTLGAPLAVVAAIYTFLGPPWPTTPVFSPGFPSSGFAFDVPFTIANKSVLFPLKHLQISCGMVDIRLSNGLAITGIDVTASGAEGSSLGPSTSASYTCPLKRLIGSGVTIQAAAIDFTTKYDSRWPFMSRSESRTDPFTLNTETTPPQWTSGTPLR